MSNIYSKLAKIKCEFQDKNIKKTGKNSFTKFKYYTLDDIMPTINDLMAKNNICCIVSFTKELATLRVINIDEPSEFIEITSPMADATVKGGTEIQGIGSAETYSRRYLYMALLDITEHDTLDENHGKPNDTKVSKTKMNVLINKAKRLMETKSFDSEAFNFFIKSKFMCDRIEDLSFNELNFVIDTLEKKDDKIS